MPLDKEPHFIVVHGVQTGTDDDIESDQQIRALLVKCLKGKPNYPYDVLAVKYEDINDSAQRPSQWLLKILTKGSPLKRAISRKILDIIGDVFTASVGTKTASKIRAKIKKQILESYLGGHPVYLIAHSLGTIYCLDVICELMQEDNFYNTDSVEGWPVQSFFTMGSPLGLTNVFKARDIPTIRQPLRFPFNWHNFHHPLDPIVSGNVFGKQIDFIKDNGPVEQCYREAAAKAHWRLSPFVVAQNDQWLLAHLSYWSDPMIGNVLIDTVWG
jgi:hypothetical protein